MPSAASTGPTPHTTLPGRVEPRRFDDAELTALMELPPGLACECPRHVAELLMQLASFEAYTAGCIREGSDDAALHDYLEQIAGTARVLFESALERVALGGGDHGPHIRQRPPQRARVAQVAHFELVALLAQPGRPLARAHQRPHRLAALRQLLSDCAA